MKITVDAGLFHQMFKRSGLDEKFSRWGRSKLFKHFYEMGKFSGEAIEFDLVSLCSDYIEEPIDDVLREYKLNSIESLHKETDVIAIANGVVLYKIF